MGWKHVREKMENKKNTFLHTSLTALVHSTAGKIESDASEWGEQEMT
jgi:hypothetical protein